MKKAFTATAMLLALLVLSGCTATETAPKEEKSTLPSSTAAVYQKISAQEAHKIMDETQGYVILDVRTLEEFEQGHIKNAVLLPVTDIAAKAEEQLKDKDQVLLVYCRSGRRSAQAAQALIEMGYTKVFDFGGIIDWTYETVTGK